MNKKMKKTNLHSPLCDNIPETLVMGHFLPWFTREQPTRFCIPPAYAGKIIEPALEPWRHWRDCRSEYKRTHLYHPLYGEYDSRDPVIIKRQLHDAITYGIDGFIINLNGKNSAENVIGLSLLEEIKQYNENHPEKPFLYIISFDSKAQHATEGKIPVSIEEDFEYLRDTWLTDAWVRNGDKPIMLIFAYNDNYEKYKTAAEKVFNTGADIVWPRLNNQYQIKSCFCWVNPDKVYETGAWFDNEGSGAEFCSSFYQECGKNPEIEYIIGGVWPGFNDSLVRWAWDDGMCKDNMRPRIICRNTQLGNTLELTWQEAVKYISQQQSNPEQLPPMPIIQLVTWNDWAESTSIEPDMESGYKNLEICKKYIDIIKKED
jgi:hypothetical protein